MDDRVIFFSDTGDNIRLPSRFKNENPKWMIYAAGDAWGAYFSYNSRNASLGKSNIEIFSEKGYNIFCCVELSDINLNYLAEHPELNVVLCILTGDKTQDYEILKQLFYNSIDLIDTDDTRFYPSSDVAYNILVKGGICIRVPKQLRTGSKAKRIFYGKNNSGEDLFAITGRNVIADLGWASPRFREISTDTFEKIMNTGGRRKKSKTRKSKRKYNFY
uniref:Uncharacterized protein n=1 Tax=viral metagenome TaxID=1070528 RepID=A0A6C0IB38_9ZZZZ